MDKEIQELMNEFGISNLRVFIEEMRLFEDYVSDNYSQIHDEAWSHVVNEMASD